MHNLTVEYLHSLLHYDPSTGKFTWIKRRYGSPVLGTVAGSVHKDGYRCIGIDGKYYLSGRLAWFYVTGNWPMTEIDHKNRDNEDDRWENLREATPKQNCANRGKRADSQQLYKGIHKKGRKWRASITINGKRCSLGYFSTPEDASNAYKAKSAEIHEEYSS